MCSINGCVDFKDPTGIPTEEVCAAGRALAHRGPDGHGSYFVPGVGFYHNRLAVMDPAGGAQPMTVVHRGRSYTVVYNGELYNAAELRRDLAARGATFRTNCDTEVLLWCYVFYGEKTPEMLNGIFAFAVHDAAKNSVFVARDRLGVKPFFYAQVGTKFYFASEVKGLLCHRDVPPEVDKEGLWQLLYLTPVTLPGSGVFRHVRELLPGTCGRVTAAGFSARLYWRLEAKPCGDDVETAAARVREIFVDAVRRQLQSDVPLAVLLSGGLDSSAVTAVAAEYARGRGEKIDTYSFEYEGNRENFKANLFQPAGDDEYAAWLAGRLGTAHTVLTAPTAAVAAGLGPAALARDLPGQADIDSSLLYYCGQIKRRHTVVLSGECSDEIFGGYPWFYRPEMLSRDFFPWLHDPTVRAGLFDPQLTQPAAGLDYLLQVCRDSRADCPHLPGESDEDRCAREAAWLSTRYFMANLLERKDRMSMAAAVEVRVPFADHRIIEYVFNLPWHLKFEQGVEKSLLRRAMTGYLPDRILRRKKSPYPKTYDPAYEAKVLGMVRERLTKKGFLAAALDQRKFEALLSGESGTWFGQLMARPQLLAWLYQLDVWFEAYRVRLI